MGNKNQGGNSSATDISTQPKESQVTNDSGAQNEAISDGAPDAATHQIEVPDNPLLEGLDKTPVRFILNQNKENGTVHELNVPYNGAAYFCIPVDKECVGPKWLADYLQSLVVNDWITDEKTGQPRMIPRNRFGLTVLPGRA